MRPALSRDFVLEPSRDARIVDADPRLPFRAGQGQADEYLEQPLRPQSAMHRLLVKARQDDGVCVEVEADRQRGGFRLRRQRAGKRGGVHRTHLLSSDFGKSRRSARVDATANTILTRKRVLLSSWIRGQGLTGIRAASEKVPRHQGHRAR